MGLEDIVDNGKNGVIELASITGNKKKMKVTIGEQKEEGASMSVERFKQIEKEIDMLRANTIRLQKILKKDVHVEKALRRKLREWDHLTDEQLILCTVNNFEMKISAQKAKKDKKGNVVEAAVCAQTKAFTKDFVIVKDVMKHLDWVVEKRGMERNSVSVKI